MYFPAGYSSHAGPPCPRGFLLGAEPAQRMLNQGGVGVMIKLSRTMGKMAFSPARPPRFPPLHIPKIPAVAKMMLKSHFKDSVLCSQRGFSPPPRAVFSPFPPQCSFTPHLEVPKKQSRGWGADLGGFRVFGVFFFQGIWGFEGSALDGESSSFSPPCPRMFLLILNLTRRHLEGADFLAKKMTSAFRFFFFFTFLKHFSASPACQARGTAGASPLSLAPLPGCIHRAKPPIQGDFCRF